MTSDISSMDADEPTVPGDTAAAAKKFEHIQSMKTEVLEILFDKLFPDGKLGSDPVVALSDQVVEAIDERNARHPGQKVLSRNNPANFLKDLIRVYSCNDNWPASLKAKKITARQVYGKKRILQFIPYAAGDKVPFPDRFDPVENTPISDFETLTVPVEARELGRADEPWLVQISVNQRVIHTHFAIHAARKGLHVEVLAHLQTSVKTQPEIDATFIATVKAKDGPYRAYVTVEAKQIKERILEGQVREQVSQAFALTEELKESDTVTAVIPMVVKVVIYNGADKAYRDVQGIYVVQFEPIFRDDFDVNYGEPETLHEMPLTVQSRSFFAPHPTVRGISDTPKPRKGKAKGKKAKAAKGK